MIPLFSGIGIGIDIRAKEKELEPHGIGPEVESIPGLESVPRLELILNMERLQSINTSTKSYFWLLSLPIFLKSTEYLLMCHYMAYFYEKDVGIQYEPTIYNQFKPGN